MASQEVPTLKLEIRRSETESATAKFRLIAVRTPWFRLQGSETAVLSQNLFDGLRTPTIRRLPRSPSRCGLRRAAAAGAREAMTVGCKPTR